MKLPNIDLDLLRGKAHYFFYCGGVAGVIPFLPVIATQLGVSKEGIGILYAILPFVGLVSKPVLSTIADKYRRHKCVLMTMLVVLLCAHFSINFIPPIEAPPSSTAKAGAGTAASAGIVVVVNGTYECDDAAGGNASHVVLFCGNQTGHIAKPHQHQPVSCSVTSCDDDKRGERAESSSSSARNDCDRFSLAELGLDNNETTRFVRPSGNCSSGSSSCTFECKRNVIATDDFETESSPTTIYRTYQFWWLASCMVIAWVAQGVITSVSDAVVYDILGEARNSAFGRTRLWGTIGWGMNTIVVGALNTLSTTSDDRQNYSPGFYMLLAFLLVDINVAYGLPVSRHPKPVGMVAHMGQLVRRPRVAVFAVSVFLVGVLTALIELYLVVYLTELGADSLLIGVGRGVQCFGGEVLFFVIAGWIIKRLGHVNCMTLVFFGYAARFFAYSFVENPWYVMPFEVLHGVTFGVFYATMTSYASILAPEGMSTSLQGIVGGLYEGAGMATGSLLGGIVYQRFGGRLMFRGFGIGAAGCCLLHAASQHWLTRSKTAAETAEKSKIKLNAAEVEEGAEGEESRMLSTSASPKLVQVTKKTTAAVLT